MNHPSSNWKTFRPFASRILKLSRLWKLSVGLGVGMVIACSPPSSETAKKDEKTTSKPSLSPVPALTPSVPSAPARPGATAPTRVFGTSAIFDGATTKTADWPGHSDWKRIDLEGDALMMHAGDPVMANVTTILYPLGRGTHQIHAIVSLDPKSISNLVINLATREAGGGENPVFEGQLAPGRILPIDRDVSIATSGTLLALQVKAAPGATDISNGRTLWRDLQIKSWLEK